MKDEAQRKTPIFVIGCPRSGTTLLGLMLDSHPDISITHEAGIFHFLYYHSGVQRWKFSSTIERRKFFEELRRNLNLQRAFGESVIHTAIGELRAAENLTAKLVIDSLFAAYLRKTGKSIWGEKTPTHSYYLNDIINMYPQAAIICLMRDPRAVFASMKRYSEKKKGTDEHYWWMTDNPQKASIRWLDCYENAVKNKDRISFVKYEELVRSPGEVLRSLTREYLRVPYSPKMLEYYEKAEDKITKMPDWHKFTTQQVNRENAVRWLSELDSNEMGTIESVLGKQMKEFGYEPQSAQVNIRHFGVTVRRNIYIGTTKIKKSLRFAAWRILRSLRLLLWFVQECNLLMLGLQKSLRFCLDLYREAVDIPIRLLPVIRTKHYQREKRRLLIIRLDSIGDFILFLDTFRAYRRIYSPHEWEITLLGNRMWQKLAENLSYADQYWFIDIKHFIRNPIYRYRIVHQVRNAGFDLVVHSSHSRRYWLGDTIIRGSGAAQRIGSEGDLFNITHRQKRRSDRWYTELINITSGKTMELERNAEFIRGLGLTDFLAALPKLPIPDNTQGRVDVMLKELHLKESACSESSDFYILFPGAGAKFRQWPVERFADLARRIYNCNGWVGVICGGPGEKLLGERLVSLAGNRCLKNLSGCTNLMEFAGIIKRSKLLIGNETGAVHIASAVGTPSVCILGGGHFGRFVPYSAPNSIRSVYRKMDCFGCNWKCIYEVRKNQPVLCIRQITVDQIIENIRNGIIR